MQNDNLMRCYIMSAPPSSEISIHLLKGEDGLLCVSINGISAQQVSDNPELAKAIDELITVLRVQNFMYIADLAGRY